MKVGAGYGEELFKSRFQEVEMPPESLARLTGIYVQVSIAVPVTLGEVLLMPLLTVNCKSAGAVPVMVTVPGVLQVATPVLESMLAIVGLDDDHCSPSARPSDWVELLLRVP
jgi:hypothetical protein